MSEKITKEKAVEEFYNIFQVGLEIEGSFLTSGEEMQEKRENGELHFEIGDDGSVHSCEQGGEELELRTDIIKNEEGEKRFLKELEAISQDHRGDLIFAYRNRTAGTHIHFDFKDSYKTEELTSNSLLAFDSIEFERFFFREYFKKFNKGKFAERLRNQYCKTYLQDVRNDDRLNSTLASVEASKGRRDRYFWLNTQCLVEGQGIEFRIYPYLQTVAGVKEVLDFTKVVLMRYWAKPKVQRRAKLIEAYYKNLARRSLNIRKLNEYEKILLNALNIINRNPMNQSSDSIEFLMDLFSKKPTAFEENDETINF